MDNLHLVDPKYTGQMLKHLEKQNELLMDAYRSMSHALHKLQSNLQSEVHASRTSFGCGFTRLLSWKYLKFCLIISALRSVGNIVTSDDHQTQTTLMGKKERNRSLLDLL
ncbi:uncharacterized protein LOC111893859 isoform X1 [Lactuca sativa]|uniref:uncharacterized protein LOC111893859 isoform X1 n=2 Tax=Lactuca sativa TaxID=4236 RepID=UPI000CD810DD|nr:uncharacterized protein LOC111893859 isoform X1 [Lactuca sativa]